MKAEVDDEMYIPPADQTKVVWPMSRNHYNHLCTTVNYACLSFNVLSSTSNCLSETTEIEVLHEKIKKIV